MSGVGGYSASLCGPTDAYVAKATFTDSLRRDSGGWPILRIDSVDAVDDSMGGDGARMFACGFAEGALTHRWIWDMHTRVSLMRSVSGRIQVRAFIHAQQPYLKSLLAEGTGGQEAAGLGGVPARRTIARGLLEQVRGMVAGYNHAAPPHRRLEMLDLLELNYDGDAFDITAASESGLVDYTKWEATQHFAPAPVSAPPFRFSYGRGRRGALDEEGGGERDAATAPAAAAAATSAAGGPAYPLQSLPRSSGDLDAWVTLSRVGHCTAAVVARVGGGGGGAGEGAANGGGGLNVWVAHNTWSDYLELARIFKVYTLRSSVPGVTEAHSRAGGANGDGTYRVLFSSYPGMVTSTDDWYELPGSGLLVTETTTSAVRADALIGVLPNSGLPAWMRVGIANALARSGAEWSSLFSLHNGGSYNCMWLVMDAVAVRDANLRLLEARGGEDGGGGGGGSGSSAAAPPPALTLASLPDGTLTVIEQSPRRIWSSDVTPILRKTGLWVSANRPFSDEIRADLGYPMDLGKAMPAAEGGGEGKGSVAEGTSNEAALSTASNHSAAPAATTLQIQTTIVDASSTPRLRPVSFAQKGMRQHLPTLPSSAEDSSAGGGLHRVDGIDSPSSLQARPQQQQQHRQVGAGVGSAPARSTDAIHASSPASLPRFLQVVQEAVSLERLERADKAAGNEGSQHLARFASVSTDAASTSLNQAALSSQHLRQGGDKKGAGKRHTTMRSEQAASSFSSSKWLDGLSFVSRGRGGEGLALLLPPQHAMRAAPYARAASTTSDMRFKQDASAAASAADSPTTSALQSIPLSYFSYADNPRGRMLARLSQSVRSARDMERMIRYNDVGQDAESSGRPYLTIAARFDLAAKDDTARAANGAIDGKVAGIEDVLSGRVHAVLGPASNAAVGLEPFDWTLWDGVGYCGGGGAASQACPPLSSEGVDGGDGGSLSLKKPINVHNLCSQRSAADGAGRQQAASSGGGDFILAANAAIRAPDVSLPCRWDFDWASISL